MTGNEVGLPDSSKTEGDDLLMFGSAAWYARRRDRWNEEARDHVRALRAYEDMHPDDSVCLSKALMQAEIAAGMERHAH